MIPALDPEVLQARYAFLARALDPRPESGDGGQLHQALESLRRYVEEDLLQISQQASPDDFATIYLQLQEELKRFAEFCAYPSLAHRATVAFAGGFSAGKSSLINALLETRGLMPVEIDPTTALPAYVLHGEQDAIYALNLHAQRISLSEEEFSSLTHDERERYGIEISRLLRAAFVSRQTFPWPRLAFIDTPGYSGGSEMQGAHSDFGRAIAELDAAQAVVWVAHIKNGILSESDLQILARLRPEQPRIILLSHADEVTDSDCDQIITQVREALTARNIPVQGVWAVSSRPRYRELLTPVREQLTDWQSLAADPRFAHRFKGLFLRYARGLDQERNAVLRQRHHINRLLTVLEDELALADLNALRIVAEKRLRHIEGVQEALTDLQRRFFTELKKIGDRVGIPLPEPDAIDLITIGGIPLRERLQGLREREGLPQPAPLHTLQSLQEKGDARNRPKLIRRCHRQLKPDTVLASLREPCEATAVSRLLRKERLSPTVLNALF